MYPHRCQLLTPYGDTATLFTSDQLCMRLKRDTKNPVIWLVDSYNFTIYLPSRLTKYGGRETIFRNRENTDFLKSRSGNRDWCFKSGKSRLDREGWHVWSIYHILGKRAFAIYCLFYSEIPLKCQIRCSLINWCQPFFLRRKSWSKA